MLDDALVHYESKTDYLFKYGLNPCCAGRCSSTIKNISMDCKTFSLNPCCAGRCSSTMKMEMRIKQNNVLILVVLDDALVPEGRTAFVKVNES